MTDSPGAILQKLESLSINQNRVEAHLLRMDESHSGRLTVIEKAIGMLAVQNEKFAAIKQEQKAQWKILDDNFKQGGTIDKIKMHQAHCPLKEIAELKKNVKNNKIKITEMEIIQASCPAKSSNKQMIAMWSVIILIGGMITALFNMAISQAERVSEIIKAGIK